MTNKLTKTTARAIAKNQKMLKVFKLIAEGEAPLIACEHVGIPYTKYRKWLIENPETIQAMERTISAIERTQLMNVVHASDAMLQHIMRLSERDDLPPRTMLEVHGYLSKYSGELEVKHGTGAREDIKAKEFLLTGPKLQRAEHRQATTTVNVKPLSDGSVDITVLKPEEIIDVIMGDRDVLETQSSSDASSVSQE